MDKAVFDEGMRNNHGEAEQRQNQHADGCAPPSAGKRPGDQEQSNGAERQRWSGVVKGVERVGVVIERLKQVARGKGLVWGIPGADVGEKSGERFGEQEPYGDRNQVPEQELARSGTQMGKPPPSRRLAGNNPQDQQGEDDR